MTDTKTEDKQTEERQVMKWEEAGVPQESVGMARAMVASGYFRNTNVAQAIVKIEMGKALGVSPIEAMQYLHIFTMGGDRTSIQLGYPLVGALIQRSGKYHFHVLRRDDEACEIEFSRIGPGGALKSLGVSRFTIEKARAVGLVNKDVWKAYPEVMLYARALTHGAKAYCPEILGGATVAADEPYIEGEARQVEEEPRVVEEPPEGFTSPWTRLWTYAKSPPPEGLGMTEDDVHEFFGVASLKDAVMKIVATTSKTEAEVVAEYELLLRESPTAREAERAAESVDADWAALAEGESA